MISVVAASARSEKDIGGNRNPKCIFANKGDLDEHPHNCETYKNERERKTKLHYAIPLRLNMNSNIGASGHRALWGRALPAGFSRKKTGRETARIEMVCITLRPHELRASRK